MIQSYNIFLKKRAFYSSFLQKKQKEKEELCENSENRQQKNEKYSKLVLCYARFALFLP